MKTFILQLDAHDDIISAGDKMNWAQGRRVLLVWPARGRVLTRRLDLALLQRRAARLGAQLAVVTPDSEVRAHAASLAIPAFSSLRRAQQSSWRTARLKRGLQARPAAEPAAPTDWRAERAQVRPAPPAWLETRLARTLFFALGLAAFLALAVVLGPSARLRLSPQRAEQRIEITLRADPAQERVQFPASAPARPLSVIVEGRGSLTASGRSQAPSSFARGEIILTNLSEQDIAIPAGTQVGSQADPQKRFHTLRSGRLPAGAGRILRLPVQAEKPGSRGNASAGIVDTVYSDLGASLAVSNPAAIDGGADLTVPSPLTRDYTRLYDQVQAALAVSAQAELARQLQPGDLLLTPELELARVIDQKFTPAEAAPAAELHLTLRLEFRALAARRADLELLALNQLDASLAEGKLPALPGEILLEHGAPALSRGVYIWTSTASRRVERQLDAALAARLAQGLPLETAARRLEEALALASAPQITVSPQGWPWLPFTPLRIEVQVEHLPTPDPSASN
jgi:hypothetical protein